MEEQNRLIERADNLNNALSNTISGFDIISHDLRNFLRRFDNLSLIERTECLTSMRNMLTDIETEIRTALALPF